MSFEIHAKETTQNEVHAVHSKSNGFQTNHKHSIKHDTNYGYRCQALTVTHVDCKTVKPIAIFKQTIGSNISLLHSNVTAISRARLLTYDFFTGNFTESIFKRNVCRRQF